MKYKKWPEIIKQVLKVSFGARFYRCAFQVNPYDYVKRHRKNFSFNLEEKYNYAIVKALKEKGIEVIAVTDHYRIHTSLSLIEKARDAGIFVFPGFEAVTKEGIHMLCLFEQDTPLQTIERFIGACGVHDEGEDSPLGNITFEELLFKVQKEWKGICIAAHILEKGGLLTALKGTARVKCWKNPELLAVALATYPEDQNIPQEYREILLNRKAEYKRERPPAFINAQDICSPEDVKKNNTWCWIKMSEVSIEALRQAFLDPGSRVRLANEEIPSEHAYLVAIAWEGGFLDSQVIHFNSDLNVLVGGRGTGKSTIIESIRYALGLKPLTEDVQKIHKGIIQNVLKPGTRIWLVIRTFSPEVKDYLIERSIPNPPIVRNEEGEVLDVLPEELISGIEIFGQQELADLSRYPQRVRALLERFFPEEMKSLQRRIKELKRRLEASRREIISLIQEKESLEEELSRLPLIEEKIQQLKGSEVEKALYEHRMILREKSILKEIKENLKEIMLIFEPVKQKLDFEVKTLLPKEPHPEEGLKYLQKAVSLCERLKNRLCYFLYEMEAEGEHTLEVMEELIKNWHTEREILTIEKLRKIEKKLSLKLDSKEITRWYREYETLKPKQTRLELLKKRLETLYEERKKMLLEWEEIIFEECQLYKKVIKKINRKLENRVRVKVVCGGDREELINFLKQNTKGLRGDILKEIIKDDSFSLKEFVDSIRKKNLETKFPISSAQADKIYRLTEEALLELEEFYFPPLVRLEFNVSPPGEAPNWRDFEDLSTGQKATVLLLLILLENKAPLIIDQPEDNLDNYFITEEIVPRLRAEKQKRQFIMATHNANIPVLGDAELIVGLKASHEEAYIPDEYRGSIDKPSVKELIEEVLEGGKAAFEIRRIKYGF